MRIYLVQHALSVSKEEDPSRSLSDRGIADMRKVAAFVQQMDIVVHKVYHSGKMRALQTAQVLEEHLNVETEIAESDGLAPIDDPQIWCDRLASMNQDVMLVGHLPHMSGLASLLLGRDAGSEVVTFEMGCIVCLHRTDQGTWSVDWLINPGMIHK
ncbi:MAG: phosphohistidine phosphatase SixA [Nitrospiraceae bacterium]|nr:MAG: phosphohistidine phosphatase SixA [Nitrospiraceae bacterium]